MSRVLKGSLIIIIFSFVTALLNYFIRLFYSRTLSIADFGLFYAGIGLVNIFIAYMDLGYSYSIFYLVPKYLKSEKYASTRNVCGYVQLIQLLVSLSISLLGIGIAPFIIKYYFKTQGNLSFFYLLVLYFFTNSILNTIYYFYIGFREEKYYSSLLFTKVLLIIILSFVSLLVGIVSVNNFIIIWIISCIITAGSFWIVFRRKFRKVIKNRLTWDGKLFQKMTRLAIPNLLSIFVYSFINYGDIFFLTLFTNLKSVAYYNIILPLVSIPLMFTSPLNNLFMPLISHLMDGEKNEAKKLINNLIKFIPLFALYFALFLLIFPSPVIATLFGSKWLGYIENWLGLLAIGFVFTSLVNVMQVIVAGLGMVDERFRIS